MALKLLEKAAADIATPASGYVTIFIDSADGMPKYKDDTGTVTTIGAGAATIADGDYGDVTISGSGTVINIDAGAVAATELASNAVTTVKITDANVTLAKIANIAANSILGNNTGSSATAIELTGAQIAVMTQGTGLDVDATGFRGVPQNSQSGNYTIVAADAGKHVIHPSGAGAGDTLTIPSNASVAFEVGTAITFVNMDSSAVTIAITSDTMNLAGAGTTGSRTLAQYGVATALKVASTTWLISGTGLT